LEIRLEGDFSGNDSNPIEYVNGMYSCITYTETDFIKNIYKNSDFVDYLPINTGEVIVVDFNYPVEKRQQIVNDGYKQTKDYFLNVLPLKRKYLLNMYKDLSAVITKVVSSFRRRKYSAVKSQFAELYVVLFEQEVNLPYDIKIMITQLKDLINSNIQVGLLGMSTCSDQRTLNQKLEELKSVLTQKTEELAD